MARKETMQCDKCGAIKQETNHWYTVVYFDDYRAVAVIPADEWLEFSKNAIAEGISFQGRDACGMECAVQLQSAALGSGQPTDRSAPAVWAGQIIRLR